MKTLKMILAGTFAAAAVLVSVNAAEAVLSPRAAANAPKAPVAVEKTTDSDSHSCGTMGSQHEHANHTGTTTPSTGAGAMGHCNMPAGGHAHKSCCG